MPQRGQRVDVTTALFTVDERSEGRVGALVLVEVTHHLDQFSRLQEDESPREVVISQRAEGFVTQRDALAESPVARGIKVVDLSTHHGLVDPAESVNGDLLDEQLLELHYLLDPIELLDLLELLELLATVDDPARYLSDYGIQ